MHDFRAYHQGVKVEILQINGAILCTLCGDDTVEMNLDCDHVNDGGITTPGIVEMIAANCEASAIGIGLFRTIVDAHAPVFDVFALVDQDLFLSNEDNCFCALANAWNAMGKAIRFDCVGLAPEFFVL